jgi:hypothetical protein
VHRADAGRLLDHPVAAVTCGQLRAVHAITRRRPPGEPPVPASPGWRESGRPSWTCLPAEIAYLSLVVHQAGPTGGRRWSRSVETIGDWITIVEGRDCHVAMQPKPSSAWLPMARG